MKLRNSGLLLCLSAFLAACGGGGGGSDSSPSSETVSANLTLGESQDFELITKDAGFYSLAVEAGNSYSIDVINLVSSDNSITITFNDESESVADGLMASFDYVATQSGTVTVKIDGSSSGSFYYRISPHLSTASGLSHDDVYYEPNNSQNAAYPVENGSPYSSELGLYDDFDWYSIDVVSGDTVTLNVSNDVASASLLKVQAFNNDGSPLSQVYTVSHTADLSEELSVTQTGKFFVKIEGQSQGADHSYDFSLSLEGITN